MMYALIALGVVMAVLMLAGVWLSCRTLTETLLTRFLQSQDEAVRRKERETDEQ